MAQLTPQDRHRGLRASSIVPKAIEFRDYDRPNHRFLSYVFFIYFCAGDSDAMAERFPTAAAVDAGLRRP